MENELEVKPENTQEIHIVPEFESVRVDGLPDGTCYTIKGNVLTIYGKVEVQNES